MKLGSWLAGLGCLVILVVCFTGCPDRSYMRPVPDYSNMTDSGEDDTGDEDETRGEEDQE